MPQLGYPLRCVLHFWPVAPHAKANWIKGRFGIGLGDIGSQTPHHQLFQRHPEFLGEVLECRKLFVETTARSSFILCSFRPEGGAPSHTDQVAPLLTSPRHCH